MDPHDVVAHLDGVVASLVDDPDDARRAVELLDACEEVVGAPLVDESERDRLRTLAVEDESVAHWHAVLGQRDDEAVGYAGITVPGVEASATAVGDVAVARGISGDAVVAGVLAMVLEQVAADHGADDVELWVRAAPSSQVQALIGRGYEVDRRLAVLGRSLADVPTATMPSGVELRSFRDDDADAVVGVLAAAYEGTPDGGWDRERFEDKRSLPWFDPQDLLVAVESEGERSGRVVGLHWTKRRDDLTGEVYNLAIHPEGQGQGSGGALLTAGMRHLADRGCREVILWVDRDNERGVRLYESHGFTKRWEDVALSRTLP